MDTRTKPEVLAVTCRGQIHCGSLRPRDGAMPGSAPGDTSRSWDKFYNYWVHPVVHFSTPMLIVFAILLTAAVMMTPLLVTKDSRGASTAGNAARWGLRGSYWLGVVCLLFSAIEATIVFPLSRHVTTARNAPWTAGVSIGLTAVAITTAYLLYAAVGDRHWPQRHEAATVVWVVPGLAGLILILGLIGTNWHYPWLDWRLAPVVYAPLLAIVGIIIVGRTRGIGIGMLLQGHGKTGADDAGLGAFVRARLCTLGSQQPAGILVTQQTDVSTLPSGALSLIPEGTLAKLAALLVSLFTPATPWRVDVTEQVDSSVVVSIRRDGCVTDATVIKASTLGLSGYPTGAGHPTEDWAAELRTGAASFILLAL